MQSPIEVLGLAFFMRDGFAKSGPALASATKSMWLLVRAGLKSILDSGLFSCFSLAFSCSIICCIKLLPGLLW